MTKTKNKSLENTTHKPLIGITKQKQKQKQTVFN